MKKHSFFKRLQYRFDCMMSKGPMAISVLLFCTVIAIVAVIGIAASFVSDDGSIITQLWNSLMYTLDPGNLAGIPSDNIPYLGLMFFATLCGLLLTSVLIGIVATGIEGKLNDLRKGFSVVQENNHTMIIGFNSDVYTILEELIEANSNKKKACVVILGEQPKEEMDEAILARIPNTGTTRIICRSGKLYELHSLERCCVETCRSVVINVHDDAQALKILLALSSYLRDKALTNPDLRFIVSLQNPQYVEAAKIAGEGRAEIIFAQDAIARIISNTCRQHGLSQVLTELFNFSGNELYFEHIPALAGRTFKDAALSFSNAVAVGLLSDGHVRLNPPMDTVIKESDQIVLLEEDDGSYNLHNPKPVDQSLICHTRHVPAQSSDHLLVLGSNSKLPIILREFDKYVARNTRVVIVSGNLAPGSLGSYANLDISVCSEPISRDLLGHFLENHTNNILLLSDDNLPPEQADSQTLIRLIFLRDIADTTGQQFAITTEMRRVDNQRLATQARVDDFVIGSNFERLLMTQISESPNLAPLIADLLDESGSELYMKPAANYVPIGQAVDSYLLTESAAQKGEIFVGYRHISQTKSTVVVNPDKNVPITFDELDQIVVIAEN